MEILRAQDKNIEEYEVDSSREVAHNVKHIHNDFFTTLTRARFGCNTADLQYKVILSCMR